MSFKIKPNFRVKLCFLYFFYIDFHDYLHYLYSRFVNDTTRYVGNAYEVNLLYEVITDDVLDVRTMV